MKAKSVIVENLNMAKSILSLHNHF